MNVDEALQEAQEEAASEAGLWGKGTAALGRCLTGLREMLKAQDF